MRIFGISLRLWIAVIALVLVVAYLWRSTMTMMDNLVESAKKIDEATACAVLVVGALPASADDPDVGAAPISLDDPTSDPAIVATIDRLTCNGRHSLLDPHERGGSDRDEDDAVVVESLSIGRSSSRLLDDLKQRLAQVDAKFRDLDLRESDSSYTEDKKTIYLCLRDKDGREYSMNTLVYVTLHEVAHFLNHANYGHTREFNAIFNALLCKAMRVGIYDSTAPHADWYCGVDIRGIEQPVCSTAIESFSVDALDLSADAATLAALPDGPDA